MRLRLCSSSDIYFIDVRYGSKVDMPGEDKRSRFSFTPFPLNKTLQSFVKCFLHSQGREAASDFFSRECLFGLYGCLSCVTCCK